MEPGALSPPPISMILTGKSLTQSLCYGNVEKARGVFEAHSSKPTKP